MKRLAGPMALVVWWCVNGSGGFAADPVVSTAGAKVRYTLDKDAVVTVNITRPDGWVVRELQVGLKQKSGTHEVQWDGRDNIGYLLPPGPYESRVIAHQGITWDYLTSVGNGGTPPWPTADRTGGWGGNHGQNMAVCVDPSGAYLGWAATEGPACILKRKLDGSAGIWSMTLGPFEGIACLAVDDKFLYGANGARLIVIDKTEGRQLATLNLQAGPPGEVKAPLPPELTRYSWNFATHQPPPKGDPLVWGLAAGGGRVYVSLPWRDVVEVYEIVAGNGTAEIKPKPDENLNVAKPAGLALDGQGGLLVVSASEKRVVRCELRSKQFMPIVTGFESPFALARASDGTMYVSEMKPVHQIKKFSPDGKLQAAWGKKGGPVGAQYVADSFLDPCALGANADGSVWFVDDQFKRMGILSTTGKPVYAGFGSVNYAALCGINPNDPNEVFTTMWVDATFKIDYVKPGWSQPGRVLKVKWKGESKGLDFGFGASRILSRDKRTYLWTGTGLSIVEQDHLRPVMFLNPRLKEDGPVGELAKQRNAKARGWNCDLTLWTDANGDSAVQDSEIQFIPLPSAVHGPQYFAYGGMQEDFSVATYGYTWKPKSFTAQGVPVFAAADIKVSATDNPVVALHRECEGALLLENGGYIGYTHATDPGRQLGQGFWSGRTAGEAVRGYGPDWKYLWRVGQKARRVANAGEIYHVYRSLGALDGCAFFSDVEGCVHVVHQDGFYVQRVLQDGWHTRAVGPDVIGIENFSGSLFKHPQTGRRYLTISSSEATHVFELKGMDSIKKLPPQPVTLTTSRIAADVAARSAKGEYLIHRVPDGAAPIHAHLNGVLPQAGLNWDADVPPLIIMKDGKPAGEVRMLYDKENLYVLAHSLHGRNIPSRPIPTSGDLLQENPLTAGDTLVVLLSSPIAAPTTATVKKSVPADKKKPTASASSAPASVFRFVAATVSAWGPKAIFQREGQAAAGTASERGKWYQPPRVSAFLEMPYQNGTCYQMVIPLAGIVPPDVSNPLTVKLDVAFVTAGSAQAKPNLAWWWGKGKNMQDVADLSFAPEGWGTATFVTESVLEKASTRAIATKVKNTPGGAGRWTGAKSYALGGVSEGEARGTYQAVWDDTTLYAKIKVTDPTPLQNRAGVPEMLFKGGDAVSLVFGKSGTEGVQQRIVAAKVGTSIGAVLYRPQSDTKKPYTFKSPVGSETFDYVAPLTDAKIAFNKSATGYVADLAIPWKSLGYVPASGKSIPFDVQVIFSDATGNANSDCIWWQSRGPDAHANNDIPTEARLYSDQWGRLLLQDK